MPTSDAIAARRAGPGLVSRWAAALTVMVAGSAHAQSADISVYAAGSLRAALGDLVAAWRLVEPSAPVALTFGASGLLKDRLLGGERADVFASANTEHPQALARAGRAAEPRVFAKNRLCGLGSPSFDATPTTLVARLLEPGVRVATSTPKADPAGDYAFAMFERIERAGHAGAYRVLADKALQLTGGPSSPPPPADRNVYAALMEAGRADVFITYCTNVVIAQREVPALRRIEIADEVNVSASYGVTALAGASEAARRFVDFMLAPAGQAVLARHGFAGP